MKGFEMQVWNTSVGIAVLAAAAWAIHVATMDFLWLFRRDDQRPVRLVAPGIPLFLIAALFMLVAVQATAPAAALCVLVGIAVGTKRRLGVMQGRRSPSSH